MKKVKYIFEALLIAILAIFLLGCDNATVAYVQNIENEMHAEESEVVQTELEETELVETQPVETLPETFDENVTFNVSYVEDGEVMPYALIEPASVDNNTPMPLIVWLHGLGEVRISEETKVSEQEFLKKGPAAIIPSWELVNFNAYIICPHLKNAYYASNWCNEITETNLANLMDKFIAEHNIDQDKIIISGTSLGGQGAIYMAVNMTEYFNRAVVLNGYASLAQCSDIEIPVRGYIGTIGKGEDETSSHFMTYYFAPQVGEDNLKVIDASHGGLPEAVFKLDNDGNGKSDVIEWMLLNKEV